MRYPKSPTTIDGRDERVSIHILINFVTAPPLAYIARYIPAKVPIGTVISSDRNTRYNVLNNWFPMLPLRANLNIDISAPIKPLIITYPANAAKRTKKNTAMA